MCSLKQMATEKGFSFQAQVARNLFAFFFYFFFILAACGILASRTGIEPKSPALEAQRLNHWTCREILTCFLFCQIGKRLLFLSEEAQEEKNHGFYLKESGVISRYKLATSSK